MTTDGVVISSRENSDRDYFGDRHLTVIKPSRGWRAFNYRELWAYRELLWVLSMRDIKVRYRQTVLGAVWAILQPVMTMLVFTIFFGRLANMPSDGYPYPIFIYAALLPWTFFANALTGASQSLVGSSQLVSKVYFPRIIIPLASIGTGILDFLVASSILLLMMLFYGVPLTVNLLAIPLLLLAIVVSVCGIGSLLAALNVAYRDFRYVIPFMVQLWMFVTPVVYPLALVPERWRTLLYINPLTGIIEGFRSAILGRPFDARGLAISGAAAVVMLIVGVAYFERVERRFADVI